MKDVSVIIVAGGSGSRMGALVPKQFLDLGGKPILVHTVEKFVLALPEAEIIVALPREYISLWAELSQEYDLKCRVCEGGDTRFGSVKNALRLVGQQTNYIMVHDGARPLVSPRLINEALDTAREYGNAVPAIEPADSFRMLGEDGRTSVVDRSSLRAIQTPQVFRADILREAYQTEYNSRFTDDATVVESCGIEIVLFEGERANIKVTTPEDMILAEALLKNRNE